MVLHKTVNRVDSRSEMGGYFYFFPKRYDSANKNQDGFLALLAVPRTAASGFRVCFFSIRSP